MPRPRPDAGGQVTIVSSDKDLMQLIRPGVEMLDPIKQKPIGPAEVMEKFGVTPDKMIDVQALIGDSTDNVPGVPGIGPKGAAQLINEFGDLEGVLAAAPAMKPSKRRDNLIEHADKARISRELVTLRAGYADADAGRSAAGAAVRQGDARRVAEDAGVPQHRHAAGAGWRGARCTGRRHDGRGRAARGQAALPLPEAERPVLADVASGFGPYVTITTEAALREFLAETATCGFLAIDTETDGLDAMRAPLVGLSLAVAPGRACYVPLRHEVLAEQVPLAAAIAALGPVLTDPAVLKIYQNAKFDMLVMERAGFPPAAPFDDTMLISYAQEAGMHGHGLDELCAAASRPHADQLRRGHRHRAQSHSVRSGADRARHRLRRRGCRRDAAAVAGAAAAAARSMARWRCTSSWNAGWCPVLLEMERAGIKVDADDLRAHVGRFRAAHGGDRTRHPSPRRVARSTSVRRSSSARCCSTR